MKSRKKFIAILIIALAVSGFWYFTTQPQIYKSAVSPDGVWSVNVYRQRTFPWFEGVAVIVEIKDNKNRVIYKETIDNRDTWQEVKERYPELICTNEEIKIGPGFWDGQKNTYFVLKRKELIK